MVSLIAGPAHADKNDIYCIQWNSPCLKFFHERHAFGKKLAPKQKPTPAAYFLFLKFWIIPIFCCMFSIHQARLLRFFLSATQLFYIDPLPLPIHVNAHFYSFLFYSVSNIVLSFLWQKPRRLSAAVLFF